MKQPKIKIGDIVVPKNLPAGLCLYKSLDDYYDSSMGEAVPYHKQPVLQGKGVVADVIHIHSVARDVLYGDKEPYVLLKISIDEEIIGFCGEGAVDLIADHARRVEALKPFMRISFEYDTA